jgi:hypothetical protein
MRHFALSSLELMQPFLFNVVAEARCNRRAAARCVRGISAALRSGNAGGLAIWRHFCEPIHCVDRFLSNERLCPRSVFSVHRLSHVARRQRLVPTVLSVCL